MKELTYDTPIVLVGLALLVSMLVGLQLGRRFGQRNAATAGQGVLEHVSTMQGSLLGLLALLLGFTFSIALNRFDTRSVAVVDEANAIGTAWLRVDLLAADAQPEAQRLWEQYAAIRVESSLRPLSDADDRAALALRADAALAALWRHAAQAATADPGPVTSGLYVQALNEVIDAYGAREAALGRHVPETVLWLLYATFLMSSLMIGFSAGLREHHPSTASYALVTLIMLVAVLIVDLDRPRRGLIQIDQGNLLAIAAQIEAAGKAERPR